MVKAKKARLGLVAEALDPLYYNQVLDVLRRQQDLGLAFYGSFVYEPKAVAPEAYTHWYAALRPAPPQPLQQQKTPPAGESRSVQGRGAQA